jgi:hypothetical protein
MSDWTARLIWKFFRKLASGNSKVLTYAGPVSILAIIVGWAALVWFGFALIYLPRLQIGFSHVPPENNAAGAQGEALSLSIGALITLSEGSYATLQWLEIVRGVEAVIGFGLLTASVSWLLSIYPVLESRRSLAEQVTLLHHAERENEVDMIHDCPTEAQGWLFAIGADLAALRNRMAQFPISYYFDIGEPQTALAGTLPYILELSKRAAESEIPSLRLSGTAGRRSAQFPRTAGYRFSLHGRKRQMGSYASLCQRADVRFDLERPHDSVPEKARPTRGITRSDSSFLVRQIFQKNAIMPFLITFNSFNLRGWRLETCESLHCRLPSGKPHRERCVRRFLQATRARYFQAADRDQYDRFGG